ncbi:MAG: NUDIX hydrolase [Patescibacteria group bacterium]
MKKIKPIARVITYKPDENKILLVRNKGTKFWYAPGGSWEYEIENIVECAKREVLEETGMHVEILKLLYLQEFHGIEGEIENICLETFWLAKMSHEQALNEAHIDLDPNGAVEEAKWFTKDDLQDLKVFPKRLKNTFWENIKFFAESEDPFIGVS